MFYNSFVNNRRLSRNLGWVIPGRANRNRSIPSGDTWACIAPESTRITQPRFRLSRLLLTKLL